MRCVKRFVRPKLVMSHEKSCRYFQLDLISAFAVCAYNVLFESVTHKSFKEKALFVAFILLGPYALAYLLLQVAEGLAQILLFAGQLLPALVN